MFIALIATRGGSPLVWSKHRTLKAAARKLAWLLNRQHVGDGVCGIVGPSADVWTLTMARGRPGGVDPAVTAPLRAAVLSV